MPLLKEAYEASRSNKTKPALFITIYVSKPKDGSTQKFDSPFYFSGRPQWKEIMNNVTTKDKAGIMFSCGPAALVSDASEVCFNYGQENGTKWDFHHEVFDF